MAYFYDFHTDTCETSHTIYAVFTRFTQHQIEWFPRHICCLNKSIGKAWHRWKESPFRISVWIIISIWALLIYSVTTVIREKSLPNGQMWVVNKWRVRWKKGGRYFTQNRTLSKTLQISHAVLFRCLKQCSTCFFPEACFLLEILRMQKNTFFRGHPLGTFCWMKNKRTFCFAKRWSHYNTLIIYYCFVSASG